MATIGFTDSAEQGLLDYLVATYGVIAVGTLKLQLGDVGDTFG